MLKKALLALTLSLVVTGCQSNIEPKTNKAKAEKKGDYYKDFPKPLGLIIHDYNKIVDHLNQNGNNPGISHIEYESLPPLEPAEFEDNPNFFTQSIQNETEDDGSHKFELKAVFNEDKILVGVYLLSIGLDSNQMEFSEKGIMSSVILLNALDIQESGIDDFLMSTSATKVIKNGKYKVKLTKLADMGMFAINVWEKNTRIQE
ncbi:hypothetical protein ACFFJY_07885 [Fictibacillus aquaticus]|uniref:Lipoprotein n=1 Tax=Fictibacillus aquaticus TaxID=2021314 RepID=A0A235F9Q9_9BACL|nr:hypothetical protein [Fictibacillus aquaticus]OYD57899.1 hypothetical protein CGZ90_08335 [Fictibacillus aquaticus]